MSERRLFNRNERRALYVVAGGHCSNCGIELAEIWHADHMVAYAAGGTTDVINGQGLCPKCNWEKGAFEMSIAKPKPYKWQDDFVEDCKTCFQKDGTRDYLLVVTPGGGKTIGALKAARELFRLGFVERIVVVAPTRTVVKQWVKAAHKLGFDLEPF